MALAVSKPHRVSPIPKLERAVYETEEKFGAIVNEKATNTRGPK